MIEANGPHYYQKPLKKLIFSAQDTENSIPNQLARSAKEGPRQILSWFPTSLNQTGRKPSLRFAVALIASRKHRECLCKKKIEVRAESLSGVWCG